MINTERRYWLRGYSRHGNMGFFAFSLFCLGVMITWFPTRMKKSFEIEIYRLI